MRRALAVAEKKALITLTATIRKVAGKSTLQFGSGKGKFC
jgi:hypothetical protein